jgi:hypothetical protein
MKVLRRTSGLLIPGIIIIGLIIGLLLCILILSHHPSDHVIHMISFIAGVLAGNLGVIVHYYFGFPPGKD